MPRFEIFRAGHGWRIGMPAGYGARFLLLVIRSGHWTNGFGFTERFFDVLMDDSPLHHAGRRIIKPF